MQSSSFTVVIRTGVLCKKQPASQLSELLYSKTIADEMTKPTPDERQPDRYQMPNKLMRSESGFTSSFPCQRLAKTYGEFLQDQKYSQKRANVRGKSKVTAAQALQACSAAPPSSPRPQEMQKLEAAENLGCAGWAFTWMEQGADGSLKQGGEWPFCSVFMLAWLIGRVLAL